MVSHRDERQTPENGGKGYDVDDRLWFRLIQLLRPALASLQAHSIRTDLPFLSFLSVFTLI